MIRNVAIFVLFFVSIYQGISGIPNVKRNALLKRYEESTSLNLKKELAFEIGESFWFERILPSAKSWALKHIEDYDATDTSTTHIRTLDLLANIYFTNSQLDSAMYFVDKSLSLAKQNNSFPYIANIYQIKGRVLHNLGDRKNSLEALLHCDSLYEASTNKEIWLNNIYIKLILKDIFIAQNQKDKAKYYLDLAMKYAAKVTDENILTVVSENEARWYCDAGEYKKAKQIFDNLLKRQNGYNHQYIYQGLGDIALKMKDYDTAEAQYKRALIAIKLNSEKYMTSRFYADVAHALLLQNNMDEAKIYLDSCLLQIPNTPDGNRIKVKEIQLLYLKKIGGFQAAVKVQDEIMTLKEKQYNKEVASMSNNFDVLNKVHEKQIIIKEIQLENTFIKKSNNQQKWINGLLLLLLFSFFVLGYFIYCTLKIEKENEQRHIIEKERQRIIRDLHDDVGSMLSSIKIYSELAEKYAESKPIDTLGFIKKVSEKSNDILTTLNDIVWSLKSIESDQAFLKSKIITTINDLLAPKNINTHLQYDDAVDKHLNSPELRKNILLIFKESFNNIAKYSEATLVNIEVLIREGNIVLHIKDNGKGFDYDQIIMGTGLKSISKRVALCKGTCTISSLPMQGVCIDILLPILHQ